MQNVILDKDSQTHVTLSSETVQRFIRTKKSDALLAAFEPLSLESKADILASNNAALFLATCGYGAKILQVLESLRNDQVFKILNSGNALDGLLRTSSAMTILCLIKKLPFEHQAELLAKPYVIARHYASTEKMALEIVEVISKLPPEQQTQILSTHNTVSALSKMGMALDVFGLISKLSAYQKDRIAVARGYQDVSSFCSRRIAKRQTPIHLECLAGHSSTHPHYAFATEE